MQIEINHDIWISQTRVSTYQTRSLGFDLLYDDE